MDWIWLIVALLVGLAVGGLVAWTVVKRRYGDRESVVELRSELDRYKGKVTDHFVETADLVNTLTRNYKRVYDHLESGAYELVGEETLRRELDAPAEAPVMLEYLGQRRSEFPTEPETTSTDAEAAVTPGAPERPTTDEPNPPNRRPASTTSPATTGDVEGSSSQPENGDDERAAAERPAAHRPDAEERTRSTG